MSGKPNVRHTSQPTGLRSGLLPELYSEGLVSVLSFVVCHGLNPQAIHQEYSCWVQCTSMQYASRQLCMSFVCCHKCVQYLIHGSWLFAHDQDVIELRQCQLACSARKNRKTGVISCHWVLGHQSVSSNLTQFYFLRSRFWQCLMTSSWEHGRSIYTVHQSMYFCSTVKISQSNFVTKVLSTECQSSLSQYCQFFDQDLCMSQILKTLLRRGLADCSPFT